MMTQRYFAFKKQAKSDYGFFGKIVQHHLSEFVFPFSFLFIQFYETICALTKRPENKRCINNNNNNNICFNGINLETGCRFNRLSKCTLKFTKVIL